MKKTLSILLSLTLCVMMIVPTLGIAEGEETAALSVISKAEIDELQTMISADLASKGIEFAEPTLGVTVFFPGSDELHLRLTEGAYPLHTADEETVWVSNGLLVALSSTAQVSYDAILEELSKGCSECGQIEINGLQVVEGYADDRAEYCLNWGTESTYTVVVMKKDASAEIADAQMIISTLSTDGDASSVSLGQKKTVKLSVNETLQLNAELTPALASTGIYSWESSKPSVATVSSSGLITAHDEGQAKITVRTTNGKTAYVVVKVNNPYKVTYIGLDHTKTIAMTVGDSVKLNAILEPTNAITTLTWKSSSSKVASVDNDGNVTALKEGKATVSVITSNNKKARVNILVYGPTKATSVALEQTGTVTMNIGDTLTLNAIMTPDTATSKLTWKSTRTKVATVDENGTVTARTEGRTTITVTTSTQKSTKVNVVVVDPTKATGITLDQTETVTLHMGETLTLNATVEPATATGALSWKSSNKKIASVADGVVTARRVGTVVITVSTANKKSATVKIQVVK